MLTDCSNPALSVIPAVERALIPVPLQLRHEMTWTDSVRVRGCAGPIPIELITKRTYRILGEGNLEGTNTILVERQDSVVGTGEGADRQHWMTVRSHGTGRAQLHLDSVTGALLRSEGQQAAEIIVTASGHSQKFTQLARELVTRIR